MNGDLDTLKEIVRADMAPFQLAMERIGLAEVFITSMCGAATLVVLPDGRASIDVDFGLGGAPGPAPAVAEVHKDLPVDDPAVVSVATNAGHITGPWTDAEKERARCMILCGADATVVAQALGRHPLGAKSVVRKLASELAEAEIAGKSEVDTVPAAESGPEAVQDTDPVDVDIPPAWSLPVPEGGRQRANPNRHRVTLPPLQVWMDYLENLDSDGWSARSDHDLVTSLARGRKVAQLAQEMELDKATVIARFKALYMGLTPTIDGQAMLIKALEARLEVVP